MARNVDLFGADGGEPVRHVEEADVLERRAEPIRMVTGKGLIDGVWVRLRLRGELIEGYIESGGEHPSRGVGLYAAREAPILGKDGVRLGTAHPGAFLPVLSVEGESAIVALPARGVTGRVDLGALSTGAQPPPRAPVTTARHVENRAIPIVNGATTIVTRCEEPVTVLDEREGHVQVSQWTAGIEITGAARDEGARCRPRVITLPTRGGVLNVPRDSWAPRPTRITFFEQAHDMYRLVHDDAGQPQCEKWTLRRNRDHVELWRTILERDASSPGEQLRHTAAYEVTGAPSLDLAPTQVTLTFGVSKTVGMDGNAPPGVGEGWGGDVWPIVVVGERAEGLAVLDPADVGRGLVGFHVEDVETWYKQKNVCEKAVSEERAAAAKLPPATARLIFAPGHAH